jgi:hypothetical protein
MVDLAELHEHLVVVAAELLQRFTADPDVRPKVALAAEQGAHLALLAIAPRQRGEKWRVELALAHPGGAIQPLAGLVDKRDEGGAGLH